MFRKFGAKRNREGDSKRALPFSFESSSSPRNIVSMALRRVLATTLALVWLSVPLLACLPNDSMSAEEMECCKKMAGNCDMGGGNHKCCDTAVNHAAPATALLEAAAFDLQVFLVAAPLPPLVAAAPEAPHGIDSSFVASSPPSLALSSILRI